MPSLGFGSQGSSRRAQAGPRRVKGPHLLHNRPSMKAFGRKASKPGGVTTLSLDVKDDGRMSKQEEDEEAEEVAHAPFGFSARTLRSRMPARGAGDERSDGQHARAAQARPGRRDERAQVCG